MQAIWKSWQAAWREQSATHTKAGKLGRQIQGSFFNLGAVFLFLDVLLASGSVTIQARFYEQGRYSVILTVTLLAAFAMICWVISSLSDLRLTLSGVQTLFAELQRVVGKAEAVGAKLRSQFPPNQLHQTLLGVRFRAQAALIFVTAAAVALAVLPPFLHYFALWAVVGVLSWFTGRELWCLVVLNLFRLSLEQAVALPASPEGLPRQEGQV